MLSPFKALDAVVCLVFALSFAAPNAAAVERELNVRTEALPS